MFSGHFGWHLVVVTPGDNIAPAQGMDRTMGAIPSKLQDEATEIKTLTRRVFDFFANQTTPTPEEIERVAKVVQAESFHTTWYLVFTTWSKTGTAAIHSDELMNMIKTFYSDELYTLAYLANLKKDERKSIWKVRAVHNRYSRFLWANWAQHITCLH